MKNLIDYIYNINEAKQQKQEYSLTYKDITKSTNCALYFSSSSDFVFIYNHKPYFINVSNKENDNIIYGLENAANNFFKTRGKIPCNTAKKIIDKIGVNKKSFNTTNLLYKVKEDQLNISSKFGDIKFYKVCNIN